MARKTVQFNGFGFPVLLVNVTTKKERGEILPDVNYQDMEQMLFEAVILKPARLSGAEVKFLRHHLDMSQAEFSKLLRVERSLVSKWEARDLRVTGMTAHAEIFLRMKLVKIADHNVADEFDGIEKAAGTKGVGKPLSIDLKAG